VRLIEAFHVFADMLDDFARDFDLRLRFPVLVFALRNLRQKRVVLFAGNARFLDGIIRRYFLA
jgi:hypothetical protein